jgi:hypothetical protein
MTYRLCSPPTFWTVSSSVRIWNATSDGRQRQARDAPWYCGNQPAYHSMINGRSVPALHRACLHQRNQSGGKEPGGILRPEPLKTDMTILEVTNATTASALWPLNRVAPGLAGNDLLLEACQHPFPVGHAQTQMAISSRSSGRLIVMTPANGSSPSAPICTGLTVQATRPPLVRQKTRKYRSGPRTPKLAAIPPTRGSSARCYGTLIAQRSLPSY